MSGDSLKEAIQSTVAATQLQTMMFGCCVTQVVYVAAKLRIPDLLAEEPRTTAEIARLVGAHLPSLDRVLRVLSALKIVRVGEGDVLHLTPLGEQLLSETGPSYAFALTVGEELYGAYGALLHTVMTGDAGFDHVFGMGYYQYLEQRPEAAQMMNAWMNQTAGDWILSVVSSYRWPSEGIVVDVGGASGTLIAAVLEAHAQIRGVLFDLPHAVEAARTRLKVAGVADRCDVVAGDFLVGVPQGGDVYVLARVLLNWDDDRARSILANCRRAMKVGGKLLVVDFVPSNDYRAITTISDLTLMVLFSQAHLRGEDELAALLRQTGFAVEQVERLASHPLLCLVEACLEESDCSTR